MLLLLVLVVRTNAGNCLYFLHFSLFSLFCIFNEHLNKFVRSDATASRAGGQNQCWETEMNSLISWNLEKNVFCMIDLYENWRYDIHQQTLQFIFRPLTRHHIMCSKQRIGIFIQEIHLVGYEKDIFGRKKCEDGLQNPRNRCYYVWWALALALYEGGGRSEQYRLISLLTHGNHLQSATS